MANGRTEEALDIMAKYHGGDKVSVNYVSTSGSKQNVSLTLGTSPAK